MSAWMCSNAHISLIVDAAVALAGVNETKEELFSILHLENERSLAYRYGSNISDDHSGYARLEFEPRLEDIFIQVRCYDYQSCEHPEWPNSKAWAICRAIETKIQLIWNLDFDGAYDRSSGADPKPVWGI